MYLRRRQSSRRTHQTGLNSVDGTIPIIEQAITSIDGKRPVTENIQPDPNTKLSFRAQQSAAVSSDETSGVDQRSSKAVREDILAKNTIPLDANGGTESSMGSQPSGRAVTDVLAHAQPTFQGVLCRPLHQIRRALHRVLTTRLSQLGFWIPRYLTQSETHPSLRVSWK